MSAEIDRGASRGNAGTILLLVLTVAALGAGALLFRTQAKDLGVARDEINTVRHDAEVLDRRAEALVGDLANLTVERNVLREKLERLTARSEETQAALEKALAELAAVRKERDEHLGKRLDLDRRLTDALSLIAELSADGN